jgi:2-oxoglutarate dehydrogenase E1 component
LICSGRVTWDLMVERAKRENAGRFAIARVEQLYPAPVDDIKAELARLPHLRSVRWVQDEPGNMGPAPWYSLNVWPELDVPVQIISRTRSSSPSVGTAKRHVEEQKELVAAAFDTESDRTVDNY